jgi:peroxiredoxin
MKSITLVLVAAASLAACSKDKAADQGEAPAKVDPSAKPTATTTPTTPTTPTTTTPPAPEPPPPVSLVGKPAPEFTLKDLDGKDVSLASFRGKTVVLEWFNPECPYVKKSHGKGSLVGTAKKHTDAGVVWLAINSGGAGKQGHDPAVNQAAAKEWSLAHPILRDESGATGKAYGATNTPHMFVIDKAGTVIYAGAIDNSPDGEGGSPEGGTLINYVDAAIADNAAGKPVAAPQTKAYGCSVKYSS